MICRPCPPRFGPWSTAGGLLLAATLIAPASAQEKEPPPLARYIPAKGLAVLVEHDGLDARAAAWKGTATYRMLTETALGGMLDTVTVQLLDRALAGVPGQPASGREVMDLLRHLLNRGFAVGYCGSLNPPNPQAGVVVIRGAAANPTFKKLIAQVPPLNEPAAKKVEQPGGRTVFVLDGAPVRWWYEQEDAVFSFAPPGGPDPVADALDGKVPSAVGHPARVALLKADAGEVPIGRLFVDLAALPPLPPRAVELGLDAIRRVDARWSIRAQALAATVLAQAPRPRRGLLALLDQPAIAPGTALKLPPGGADSTLMAVDPIRTVDTILALMKLGDPKSAAQVARLAEQFREQSGLSVRDDLLGKLGPRVAIAPPGGGGSLLGVMGLWFTPPDLGVVVELKDAAKFAANLDRLMEWANRELKARGSLVPAPPGTLKGTDFAEFRRIKGQERGYILAVPPAVLPTPAGLRPTVLVDATRGLLALGGSPASARRALASLVLTGPATPADRDRPGEFVRVQADSSAVLPEVLASLPSLVQLAAISAAQPRGPAGPRPAAVPSFRLELDPDAIPEAGALRPFLFPSRFAMAADNASIRMSLDMAFPLPIPTVGSGAEVPVLVALLLPAVQAAREAARRAQCTNNLKQVGLAMHNFAASHDNFPAAAIRDKQGKPLLSWRVALLPYLEQEALYARFKLDEPWDGPTNRELIKLMPAAFACPSRPAPGVTGETYYRAFTSPGSIFDARRPGCRLADITDGLANTLMVVEARDAVPWTKPEGLTTGQAGAPPGLPSLGVGSPHPGVFNALLADGSVRSLKNSTSLRTLEALITRAGGEVVSADSN